MLKIVTYPDPALTPAVSCVNVVAFDGELQHLVDNMIESMYISNGVGLAAPQVGVSQRVIIIDPSAGDAANQLVAMINPMIVWSSAEIDVGEEGCLSLPGVTLTIPRSKACDVEYIDIEGTAQRVRCVGWHARIVQHELDHLQGMMMLDRVGTLARRFALRDLGSPKMRRQ